ncbi:MAG: mechanosensitive ion channel family protein [Oscillospiraceae bacterium]|nr:mechanosensitive ion channel family protein [Oscillospiraceae bacterium]
MKKQVIYIVGFVLAAALAAAGYFKQYHLMQIGIIWAAFFAIALVTSLFSKKKGRAATIATLIRSICGYAAAIATVFFLFDFAGADLTTTLAAVGVTALIVGFAAQSLIEDLITGIFIAAEGKFNIGDYIMIDDFRGKVVDMGLRTTTIEDAGGNKKIVNNSDIRNFQNRSQDQSIAVSTVAVTYGQKLEELEKVLAAELPKVYAEHQELFLGEPKYLGVEEFQDSGILIKVIAPVNEEKIFAARRELNRQLKLIFDRNGIEIPFPQVVVHGGK